jgi:hypothetical protein
VDPNKAVPAADRRDPLMARAGMLKAKVDPRG